MARPCETQRARRISSGQNPFQREARALPEGSHHLKTTPHDLRHSNATLLIASGAPLGEIALVLGRRDLDDLRPQLMGQGVTRELVQTIDELYRREDRIREALNRIVVGWPMVSTALNTLQGMLREERLPTSS